MPVITSTVGFPRIGAHRELKKAIESYWKGTSSLDAVRQCARELRRRHWQLQAEQSISLIPSNDFSYYDQMLDTAVLLGCVPVRYQNLHLSQEDTLFAMARGYQGPEGDVTALPMKKWFTTNYHYLVPEIDSTTDFHLNGSKIFDEFQEAQDLGLNTKPVVIGPYTFLQLARNSQAESLHYDVGAIDAISAVYGQILERLRDMGADWVQFDEPYLVMDKEPGDIELFTALYNRILPLRKGANKSVKLLLQTYFGHISDCYETVKLLAFDGLGLDMVEGAQANLEAIERYGCAEETTLFLGLVNGRNIWRNNYADSLHLLEAARQVSDKIAISSSCSLLHVPYSVQGEEGLSQAARSHFAFAQEKLAELASLAQLTDTDPQARVQLPAFHENQALFDGSRIVADQAVSERIESLSAADYQRQPVREQRQRIQQQELGLPLLPTTTIGSFPQTAEVRAHRAQYKQGSLNQEQYDSFIAGQIDQVIEQQERTGLDVLVHGEFERNDMVEYFGQNLNGFLFTANAWVQSYGTRCVKPPIVWSDISRARPITVRWSSYAQSRTSHPVKGMLTGPVTILNWSWPREDISHELQTQQLALAIRDEVLDLEAAGIRIIQIDEAALREKLPLRRSDWQQNYLDWAIPAFRLVHSGVKTSTQIHTHMCYSEFNDIIRDIDAMDADVISFEASRSDLTVLDAIHDAHFETEAGPGVYDIHSPRVPSQAEIEERIRQICSKLDISKVWINPDCGLKTRTQAQTWPSLEHMVAAAHQVRDELGHKQG